MYCVDARRAACCLRCVRAGRQSAPRGSLRFRLQGLSAVRSARVAAIRLLGLSAVRSARVAAIRLQGLGAVRSARVAAARVARLARRRTPPAPLRAGTRRPPASRLGADRAQPQSLVLSAAGRCAQTRRISGVPRARGPPPVRAPSATSPHAFVAAGLDAAPGADCSSEGYRGRPGTRDVRQHERVGGRNKRRRARSESSGPSWSTSAPGRPPKKPTARTCSRASRPACPDAWPSTTRGSCCRPRATPARRSSTNHHRA